MEMIDRYEAYAIPRGDAHEPLSGDHLADFLWLRKKNRAGEDDDLDQWQQHYYWLLGHSMPREDTEAHADLIRIAQTVIAEYNRDPTSSVYHDAIGELDAELCRQGFEPPRPAPVEETA